MLFLIIFSNLLASLACLSFEWVVLRILNNRFIRSKFASHFLLYVLDYDSLIISSFNLYIIKRKKLKTLKFNSPCYINY